MKGDPGGQKQNSAIPVRGGGDRGAGRVRRSVDGGRCSRRADCPRCERGRSGAAGSDAPHEGALQEVELQDRLRRLLRHPALCRQPDQWSHRRCQEHRLRAGREGRRQPQRSRCRRQRQDASERGHRRLRRLPGARELPAGNREAPEVGQGSGGHRGRGDASGIPAGRAGTVPDREERRHLHGETGEEAVPRPDPATSSEVPSRPRERPSSRVTRAPSPASSRSTRASRPTTSSR